MTSITPTGRVLAITPSSKGFGFAVLEEPVRLVDWGVKSVSKNKNAQSIVKVQELITLYTPQLLAVPDDLDIKSRRSERVRQLIRDIIQVAEKSGVEVHKSAQEEVREHFFNARPATRHDVATFVAKAFPGELGPHLPPKRQFWMSEDYRMNIFSAVALAITSQWNQEKLKS